VVQVPGLHITNSFRAQVVGRENFDNECLL